MSNFKKSKPENVRITESSKIIEKYPERIPVIVEKSSRSKIADIDKNKYLVPKDMTMGQFIYVVRKKINLDSSQALFLFVDNVLCNGSKVMADVYNSYKDKDGFLYITYSTENTFG